MKPIKQYIKTKKILFYEISEIIDREGCVSNLDLIELGKKHHFTKSTCTQYAKLYRNLNDLVAVLISHKQYLKLCTYKQFTKYHGKQHAYARHHSITIRREDLHLLLKSNTVKMAKDGTYYLCIDVKKYYSKDTQKNIKNFFKVLKKRLKAERKHYQKQIKRIMTNLQVVIDRGTHLLKNYDLMDLVKLDYYTELKTLLRKNGSSKVIHKSITGYNSKLKTNSYIFINKNILSSKKTQKITNNLNKQERKSRYFEKNNKERYKKRMLHNFRTLTDGLKYNCGISDFTKSKLHREILQEKGGSRLYKKENEALLVNMYLKFRYNKYEIDKKKPINLKEEIEIIREWRIKYGR